MSSRRSVLLMLVCAFAALAIAACGGSPSGPNGAEGVTLTGRVQGAPVGFVSAASGASSSAATLTVTVVGTSITATVNADGSFTLRGLPEGSFTLEFFLDGSSIGTIAFDEVQANQEISIVVQVNGTTVTLVEEHRNGIGHGDVEIEGKVESALLNPAGDSTFVIHGYTVVARPGQTAIREGNKARSVEDVTVGHKVHVKGVWETNAATGAQQVLAHEIKLQDEDNGEGDDGGGGGDSSWCPDAGHKAEVEGKITAKGASDITVFQQGKGDYVATVDGSTRIRKGNSNLTFEQLAVGNRVHVKGSSQGLSGDVCNVQATEIKLQ